MLQLLPKHVVNYGEMTINIYHGNKGEGLPRHEHVYPHLTMCQSGSCVVRKNGIERIINKHSTPINLRGSEWHEIEVLEDGTVFINVFAEGKQ